jgi:AraC family transcriptional activator of pobA
MDLYDSNMPRAPDPIQSFALFGESAELPDLMHCETIAARSVLHDWEIAVHRHARLHQILFVAGGGGSAQLEGGTLRLAPRMLLNLPPDCVHGFRFDRGTDGFVTTLPEELVDELLAHAADARSVLRHPAAARAGADIERTIRRIWREFDGSAPARALLLRGMCATLLGLVARTLARAVPLAAAEPPPLVRRFEALLDAHYKDHWQVADYARALAVSPTHLSRVVRAATGAPASKRIADRVMREARRNLAYTSMNVATVAYALGFSDPAYFSRRFARAVGVSPRAFRARLAARPAAAGRAGARR